MILGFRAQGFTIFRFRFIVFVGLRVEGFLLGVLRFVGLELRVFSGLGLRGF